MTTNIIEILKFVKNLCIFKIFLRVKNEDLGSILVYVF